MQFASWEARTGKRFSLGFMFLTFHLHEITIQKNKLKIIVNIPPYEIS